MTIAATNTYQGAGLAEDFDDIIYNISPEETPLLTMCKRVSATATYHQFQTDTLSAAGSNRQLEGLDSTFATLAATTVNGTYLQIASKTVNISNTYDVVKKYGRKSETAYQLMKAGKALKIDMDYAISRNQASSAGSIGVVRSTAGIESWIAQNRIIATGNTTGTTPVYTTTPSVGPTDGTASTFVESDLTTAIQAAWIDGGDPSVLLMSATNKNRFNSFSGIATKYNEVKGTSQAVVSGAADMYVSSFGNHIIKLSRQVRDTAILCVDPDYVALAVLRPIEKKELAATGDSTKFLLTSEFGFYTSNESAHAKLQGVGA